MPRLLVVHHTSSPAMQAMLEAVVAGAHDPELEKIDVCVMPALAATIPDVLYVHGASDTSGAVRAVKTIVTGLGWAEVVNPVVAIGPVGRQTERECYELGATVAANLG